MRYSTPVSVIKIPAHSITPALLDDDEITWNKMLFDVLKRQMPNDTLYIYALTDEQEQSLVDEVAAYVGAATEIAAMDGCTLHPVKNVIKLLPLAYLNLPQNSALAFGRNSPAEGRWKYLRTSQPADTPTPPPKKQTGAI